MDNLNVIRVKNETNNNVVGKKFYYGRVFQKDNTGKLFDFMVSNHMEEDKKYKFRYITKCKAGFQVISETNYEQTPEVFISSIYGFLENVQVWIDSESPTDTHKGIWLNVLTTKGKKFHSIDKNFLLNLKVGNVHNSWKKMVDFDLWKRMESKTHADYAYKMNNVTTEEVAA